MAIAGRSSKDAQQLIDEQFAMMADDADYQKEAILIAGEFTATDWESFEITEHLPRP